MIFNKFTQKAIFLGLLITSAVCPVVAQEAATQQAIKQIPTTLTYIPGGEWVYTETLGNRPGTCLLVVLGLIATNMVHNKYKDYHNNRAKTRRQLWEKIQKECYDFSQYGLSKGAAVRNFQDPNIAAALLAKKTDWLQDARGIYNWGLIQDGRLVSLLDEFFLVLQNKTANVAAPVAPAPAQSWWKFWQSQRGQRLLPDILTNIEECLMGSCD